MKAGSTVDPAGIRTPLSSTGARVTRGSITPVSPSWMNRLSSSTAAGILLGSACSAASCSGKRNRVSTNRLIWVVVVSWPPIITPMLTISSSSSVSRSESTLTLISAVSRSSPGWSRRLSISSLKPCTAAAVPSGSTCQSPIMVSDHSLHFHRSCSGMPNSSLITATGSGVEKPATRSTGPGPASIVSKNPLTSSAIRGRSSSTRRGVKA